MAHTAACTNRRHVRNATRTRRPFPGRTLHLIDIENLAGTGLPTAREVRDLRDAYASRVGIGPLDHVVIACNHLAIKAAGYCWPDARYLVRSGPDGADLALLDVIKHENVAGRFTSVAIASGDHAFTMDTSLLGAAGCEVTVVARYGHLAKSLELAAGRRVVYIDSHNTVSAVLSVRPRAGSGECA
jgi:hypothetical protein